MCAYDDYLHTNKTKKKDNKKRNHPVRYQNQTKMILKNGSKIVERFVSV